MDSLRSLPISRRLWLILAVAIVMLVVQGSLLLRAMHTNLYTAKSEKTHHLVQSTTGILKHFYSLEVAGTLSREEAQHQALETIRDLRYGNQDYFWINDLTPVMIMHPTNPSLDGQNLSDLKDADGVEIFNEMVRMSQSQGAGEITYRWPKTGSTEAVAKTSYVELFKPWGWIVGSGVYIDELKAIFQMRALYACLVGLGIVIVMGLFVALLVRSITRPLNEAVSALANIASGDGDLTRNLEPHGRDEVSELARHFNTFTDKLRNVISQSLNSADTLDNAAKNFGQIAQQSLRHSEQQAQQMELVATAINEVTYAVQDVSKNAEHASGEVYAAEEQAQHGRGNIEASLNQINQLSGTITRAVEVIQSLAQESTKIGSVLEVIRSIAEQTNLLALNAAIEAARAGEQGRGFAVVADEVRLLAQRTQKSTAEIQEMIERLQLNSEAAVKVIMDSSHASQLTIEQATQAGASLTQIVDALHNLTGLNTSIASATLQQSHVVEDINQNVTEVAGLTHQNVQAAQQSSESAQHLAKLAEQLNKLLSQFKV